MTGAERESDHCLVRAKTRLQIKRSKKTKKSGIKKQGIDKVNKKEIKVEFITEVRKCTKHPIRRSGRHK